MRIISIMFLSFLLVGSGWAQAQRVSGTISDNTGEPLIGVTVVEKGTTNGTITDINGNYQLNVAGSSSILVFSSVGFTTIERTVGSLTDISFSLEENTEQLEEVVVIGYGSVRKSDLTGAVSSVKTEDLLKIPVADPVQALQGKVSGLQILNTSGDPGAAPVIRLRGVTTLNENSPIFVVDGVIIEEGNSLDFLNANDIESVEVLKDASATAIFGSRGSNGVIIVSTKRGEKGTPRINLTSQIGFESVAHKIDVMNGRQFAEYINDIDFTYSNIDALDNVDWQDEVYRQNAPITSTSLSVGGASEKVDYYFSMGHFLQQGLLPKSSLKRITTKINSTFHATDKLDIGVNLSVALKNKKNAPGVVTNLLRAWPIDPPTNSNGKFLEVNGGGNPLAAIAYSNSTTRSIESVGNVFGQYEIIDGLKFKSSFQFTMDINKDRNFTPSYFVAPLQENQTSDLTVGYGDNSLVIFENTVSYEKEIDAHRFSAVAGYTIQEKNDEILNGTTENLLRSDEDFWYLDAGEVDSETNTNNARSSSMLSSLFRVVYSFQNKYLLTTTLRRDGSSKFGKNNRYGVFPSVAVGWNVSDESFFPATDIIGNVKVRASWGLVGNEKIPQNDQYSVISSGYDAVFGSDEQLNAGATFASLGNPDLKWEETEQIDLGLNFDMFGGKLRGEIDYYKKTTSDILALLSPAGFVGNGSFGQVRYNVATVENKGLEFNLGWSERLNDDMGYRVSFLGSTLKNVVTDLGQDIGADSVIVAGDLGNGQQVSRTAVGLPIGVFYGYKVIGVFQDEAQLNSTPSLGLQGVGDFIYLDANGDGELTTEDRVVLGNSVPDFIYGFSTEFDYKGLTLGLDFQGQIGVDIYNGKQAIQYTQLNYETKFVNHWTPDNPSNEHPRASQGGVNFSPSDYFIEDGSFLRLRSVSISYSIPISVLEKLNLSNASVYLRGTNLFTKTDFTGYSPDLGVSSPLDGVIDRGVYPISRIITFGTNITF